MMNGLARSLSAKFPLWLYNKQPADQLVKCFMVIHTVYNNKLIM